MFKKSRTLMLLVLALVMVFASVGCSQQAGDTTTDGGESGNKDQGLYPSKPIELVLPVKAGGDTDVNGRIFSKYLTQELGQSVVVVNMGGAGGSIGSKEVLNSPADGYKAVWYHNSTILNNLTGVTDVNYTDFKVATVPLVDTTAILVARTESGWKDLNDMLEHAKANPNTVTVGMETATLAHLVPVAIEEEMGVDLNIVDIGAGAARLSGLLGGQIDTFFVQYGLVKDYIETGEFVALCALSEERNESYPEIPTAKEQGCNLVFDKFFYFGFPSDTPDEVVATFAAAVERAVQNEDLKAEFAKLYLYPEYHDVDNSLEIMKNIEEFYEQYVDILK